MSKLLVSCLILTTCSALIVSISGCNNPTHSPPITGDIEVSKNREGDLCFMPLLNSATFIEEFINLKHIKMENLVIQDFDTVSDGVKIIIKPVGSKFFILEKGQKICLNSDDPKLEQVDYAPIDTQSLSVIIDGLDNTKDYSISFSGEFDYSFSSK